MSIKNGLLVLFFSIPLFLPATTLAGPKEQLQITIDQVLSTLKNDTLEKMDKRKTITDIIAKRFDYRAMSQRTLAVNWKKASPEQKNRFVDLFSKLLQGSYLNRIEAYTNEKIRYGNEKIKKKTAMVNTQIITPTVEIPIDYKLIDRNGEWMVYDVVIENVSLIRNYSSTYKQIVKKDGISGLLDQMESKLSEMNNKTTE